MTDLLLVLAGVCLLYLGGEGLVRGATSAGRRMGLDPMVVGLTIVSMGTSGPELAATLTGVLQGKPAIALGNVVGSNISNLGFVLGVVALIWPLNVAARFIRREAPIMIATSGLVYILVYNGVISRFEGILLLVLLIWYVRSLLRRESETPQIEAEFQEAYDRSTLSPWLSATAIAVGIALLIFGARILIEGAVGLASTLGVSNRVVGLTMVALGTSLPELASCIVAARHHESDVVLGNLIGSNLFNILFILGLTAVVRPIAVDTQAVWMDLHVMMGISILAWFFLRTRSHVGRFEGVVLILVYATYIGFLFT
jgi:cation:H+ antiporter